MWQGLQRLASFVRERVAGAAPDLAGRHEPDHEQDDVAQHLVFITIPPRSDAPPLTKHSASVRLLAEQIWSATRGAGVTGSLAVRGGEVSVHLYAPDADEVLRLITPVLRNSPVVPRARVLVRYGPVGAREMQLTI